MNLMKELLEQNASLKPPKIGDIVEGKVILKKAFAIYLDLGVFGTGVIYGKELQKSKKRTERIKNRR